ncbi:rfaE bifunctional protein kinase chain/domain [Dyadobacter jejuensis]|uniref:RfaE bifunctional protein kinase chain/domain n=1 Tax=Dyadobacter jejuensis TaxID=1082580 RepID=A0A316AFL0_9BACT|nr:bifunctional ADP-heptose synthase [Dyadobacter jejuensis]PWJ56533.1 rfaE bifunctional protein kinase chain/domain [Dyadobacter jejuensis]
MEIPQLFEAFNQLKVLVVGDVMLDSYVWGKAERISPEAPVPVVQVTRREYRLGGAGNVLLNVQALGAEAIVCSVIGTDGPGDLLEESLKQKGLNCDGLIRSPQRITTIKERIIAGSQQVVRIDTETEKDISDQEQELLLQKAAELIPSCQVIIFEDYDKGVLTSKTIAGMIALAKQHGVPTVVDPKKRNFLAYQGTTLFKPNLKELREGLKIEFNVDNPVELANAVVLLKERLQADGALITLSERGVYIDYQQEQCHLPAHIRQITDVSGAGDTVISIAACCVALQLPPTLIAAISNLGGGLVCERIGVVPIDKARLQIEAEKLDTLAEKLG